VLPTAHDMSREYRVLSALADGAVPVPRPLALCRDETVNGAPFYVMEHRPGIVPVERLPEGFAATPEERRRMGLALVDVLVRLHAVDPEAVGLGDFGRPEGYLERQVRRWAQQWERSRTRPLPAIDRLARWLAERLPESPAATIVHGDYRLGNMAFDPDDPGRVLAVYDWEMATLGDPLADLGYTLIYWAEPGDPEESRADPLTAAPGFPTRRELCLAYAEASGRDLGQDLGRVDFYCVLALYKLAIISEGILARFRMGKTVGEGFERFEAQTERLAARAVAISEGASLVGAA
jgi:aminoglycoside phosphotransferase (APT) family kinase protein